MNTEWLMVVVAVALGGCALSAASAGPLGSEKKTFVEDFTDGRLDRWGLDEKEKGKPAYVPAVLEIVQDEGKPTLHLVGGKMQSRVYYLDHKFRDFSLEVRMKKSPGGYAGVEVRDHWRVYFQMRGYLSLNCDLPDLQKKGELFKSGEQFTGYHTLKVVCAGPLLHASVDGRSVFTYNIGPGEGRIALYSHGGAEAFYQQMRIETGASPEQYLWVEPVAPEGCLVFPPGRDVALEFRVSNASDEERRVTVAASVKTWEGTVVKEAASRDVRVGPNANATTRFDMGTIPAGFYRVDLRASWEGKPVCHVEDLPLAVQERGTGEFQAPVIPVAAYYKYFNKRSPLYEQTYAHAAARSLREHHFNAVVADPSFTREVMDIFQSYGIATISRGQLLLDHPGVIATLVRDEPKAEEIEQLKQEYDKLRAATDKPMTTCMVGEGIGLGGPEDPVQKWKQLGAGLRCFRWYGIKKSFYDPLYDLKYKGWLPLPSIFRIVEASSDTPWWFVVPALGRPDHEAYYHKPMPSQTKMMMHLALAYGCDGFLFWAFQSHQNWPCLVDQQSLAPVDENYAAAAEIAAQIHKHADLLKALALSGLDVRCPSPVVEARPLRDTRNETLYVYVVNKDARNRVSTRLLLWADVWNLTQVHDVYTGKALPVQPRDAEGYLSVPLDLAAGDGLLLATDAALKNPRQ